MSDDDLDALRREIAERLGWRKREVYPGHFTYEPPNDEMLARWGNIFLPPFDTDANAALVLLDGLFWNAWGGPRRSDLSGNDRFMIEIGDGAITFNEHLPYEGSGKTFAEAICRAWLAWKDGQDGK